MLQHKRRKIERIEHRVKLTWSIRFNVRTKGGVETGSLLRDAELSCRWHGEKGENS